MLKLIRSGAFAACIAAVAGSALPAAALADEVKLGQIEAQTGTNSTYGWMSVQGTKLAVDEINRAGGFKVGNKTYTINLISPDTQGSPQQALIQLKQLIEQEQVKFVFGPFLSNVFNGIEPYATQNNGKFLLLGGATSIHGFLGQPNHEYLMRSWNWDAGPQGFGKLMVDDLKTRGVKRVALLFPNDAFGKIVADTYPPMFKAVGIDAQVELFQPGTTDFSASLAKLSASKPDYLFPGYSDAVLYDIVRQATETGLFKKFFLVRGSLSPGLKNKDAIDDYLVYSPKYFEKAEQTEPKVKKFIDAYKAYYKRDFPFEQAPLCSSSCYDHVYMLVEAMKRAGTVDDVAKIRKQLQSMTYSGLWNLHFDSTGEEVFGFDIVDLKKGVITASHIEPK